MCVANQRCSRCRRKTSARHGETGPTPPLLPNSTRKARLFRVQILTCPRWLGLVGAHFGLTPKRYQSGETDVVGGITRVGDASVRVALHEAVNVLLTRGARFSSLKHWVREVAKRRGARHHLLSA